MTSLLHTPIEQLFSLAWRRVEPAHKIAFLAAVCVSVLAFGFEMTNLTLHHDDVNQIFIQDTILGHYLGRFGSGWLHYYAQNHYFMPFLQMAEGIVLMAGYGVLVAHFWGARKTLDIALVAAILSVFPYMAQVYQYNTAMMMYPAAHLLAAAAVVSSARASLRGIVVAALLYVGAFSIYQGVASNAATIFLVWLLARLMFPSEGAPFLSKSTFRSTAAVVTAVLAGGALYFFAVSFMDITFDSYQSAEQALKPGGGIDLGVAIPAILRGTRNFYLYPESYFPDYLKKIQIVFLGGAALACVVVPRRWWERLAALALLVAACFTPRALQLLHAGGQYHELTLTGYALVIAAAAMIILRATPILLRNAGSILAVTLIASYILQCNWISTVTYLNTLAHYATLTQILARVRALPDARWDGKTIAVVGKYRMSDEYPFKRATGVAAEFMQAHHMDKLARLMRDEAKFIAADATMPKVLEFAATHPRWPHPASVGIVDGKAVVVLSASPQARSRLAAPAGGQADPR